VFIAVVIIIFFGVVGTVTVMSACCLASHADDRIQEGHAIEFD
jgi:hypothetical protein